MRSILRISVLASAAFLTFGLVERALATESWPMFGHDAQHSGRSGVDASSNQGALKWDLAIPGSSGCGAVVIAADGTLFAVGAAGLYAVNPNGTQKWLFATGQVGECSTPAVGADGTIYVASEQTVYAVNADGTERWQFVTTPFIDGALTIGSDGAVYAHAAHTEGGFVYAINADGTQRWIHAVGPEDWNYSPPTIASDGTAYVTTRATTAPWGELVAINADGTRKWTFPACNRWGGVAVASDGTVYLPGDPSCADGPHGFFALNPDGSEKWSVRIENGGIADATPAIGADGSVYFQGGPDYFVGLYAFDADGSLRWMVPTGEGQSPPAIDSVGTLHFSAGGKMYAIRSDGMQKWTFDDTVGPPSLGPDGLIYLYIGGRMAALGACGPSELVVNGICTPVGSVSICGNTILETGEFCDDGNTVDGDCCSSDCSTGVNCDDNDPCTRDECIPETAGCVSELRPATTCRTAGNSALQFSASQDGQMKWIWKSGDATTCEEFGLPDEDMSFDVCVYDSSGLGSYRLATSLHVPASNLWQQGKYCRWEYRDRSYIQDGLGTVKLSPGVQGRAAIHVKAQGPLFPLPLPVGADQFFSVDPDLTVQLSSGSGLCWQSQFVESFKNTADRFKTKRKVRIAN